jgi:hypothetical protein
MTRMRLASSLLALTAVACVDTPLPPHDRIEVIAAHGVVTDEGGVAPEGFRFTGARVLAEAERTTIGDDLGSSAGRFDLEVVDEDSGEHGFLGVTRIGPNGDRTPLELPVDEAAPLDLDVVFSFGFPDIARVVLSDDVGVVALIEMNGEADAHALGDVAVSIGDAIGGTDLGDCGDFTPHALVLDVGDEAATLSWSETERLPLGDVTAELAHVMTVVREPTKSACPDSGGTNVNWFARRVE